MRQSVAIRSSLAGSIASGAIFAFVISFDEAQRTTARTDTARRA
jgi:ABC-type spermidine/putrescine transport system permease subunit II